MNWVLSLICLGLERRCRKEQNLSKKQSIGKETEVNPIQRESGFNSHIQHDCLHPVINML